MAEEVAMAVEVAMTEQVEMAADRLSSSVDGGSSRGRSRCWWSDRCCYGQSSCSEDISSVPGMLLLLLVGGSLPALYVAAASRADRYLHGLRKSKT